jgi:hypothetical protein
MHSGRIKFRAMSQETALYLTNIMIGVILAGMLTDSWLRQGRSKTMLYWMLGAWVMSIADIFFALRPELPYWLARTVPTLLVTLGHLALLFGARVTARQSKPWSLVAGIIGFHAAGLVLILWFEQLSAWRLVFNGLIWAGLSLASLLALRQAPKIFWQPLFSPANVFLGHAAFHLARLALSIFITTNNWTEAASWLQIVGDMEVSLFMIALFVGILIANLQLRHEELTSAHIEMHTLGGLLPMCAWCKKVRDDDGYWRQVEEYINNSSQIRITHGICVDCLKKEKTKLPQG